MVKMLLELVRTLGHSVIAQTVQRVFDHFVHGEGGLTQNRLEQLKLLGLDAFGRELELAIDKAFGG